MTTREIMNKDFQLIFPSVFNENTGLSVDDIFDTSHSYIINELDNLYGVDDVIEKERKTVVSFLKLMDEEVDSGLDFDPEIEQELRRYINRFPNQASFNFFLIYYMVDGFIEEGPSDKEILDFYKNTFENLPNLIELDDFFSVSRFLLPILLCDKHPVELIGVFKDAIKKYPGKAYLKNTLSRIYETNKAFDSAFSYAIEFLGQLETEKVYDSNSDSYHFIGDNISIDDFHLGLLSAANLAFKNEDYRSSLVYCNKLLQEYQQNKNEIYSFQNLFIDPIIIRLKIYMIHNDEAFKKDFELLKSKVDPEVLLQEEYRSIILYAKKIKLY